MELSLTSTEERVWAGSRPASGQLMPRAVASHYVQRDADRFPWSARQKLRPAARGYGGYGGWHGRMVMG